MRSSNAYSPWCRRYWPADRPLPEDGPIRNDAQHTFILRVPEGICVNTQRRPRNRWITAAAVRLCWLGLTVVSAPPPANAKGSSNWSARYGPANASDARYPAIRPAAVYATRSAETCFGPNGAIARVINRIVPQHLHPNVVIHNIHRDIERGKLGRNNELCRWTPLSLTGARE